VKAALRTLNSENVKTAGRTLDIFEAFAKSSTKPMSLTDLAQLIDSPMSSAHALIRTLRARGYVYLLEGRKLIYPTKRLLTIAQLICKNDPIVEIMAPAMRRLHLATDETIILGKRQGSHVTYLEVIESRQSIRYSAKPGDTKPLHSTSIGKSMLGLLSDKEVAALLAKVDLKAVTDTTIVDAAALLRNIQHGRKEGLFITRGENVADVMAIAASFMISGEPVSIAIAGPMIRLEKKEREFGMLLKDIAAEFAELEMSI